MPAHAIVPVILSGGSGTRLWPLSREAHPKQFHALVGERTLFQETVERASSLGAVGRTPMVVCNESHRFLVAEQLRELGLTASNIVLEPAGRNTAPAVAAAALLALQEVEPAADTLLLVLPADHVILDEPAFNEAVEAAVEAAGHGYLVTFGVVPTRPETGYGYLRRGASRGAWSTLEQFIEKPDPATAEAYLVSGRYLWNSGMFLLSARVYLDELREHAPAILRTVERAVTSAVLDPDFTRLGPEFEDCPAESIDYAVMEKTRKAAVVPLAAGWSDVGSWVSLREVLEQDADGNVLRGDVVVEGSRNSLIAAHSRRVGVVGLEEIIVVETEEAVLVMSQQAGQELRTLVKKLRS
jgi:mannose-1-phosphate guanylyltransferase/mannose-6-phosphate isomerase